MRKTNRIHEITEKLLTSSTILAISLVVKYNCCFLLRNTLKQKLRKGKNNTEVQTNYDYQSHSPYSLKKPKNKENNMVATNLHCSKVPVTAVCKDDLFMFGKFQVTHCQYIWSMDVSNTGQTVNIQNVDAARKQVTTLMESTAIQRR